MIEIVYKEEKKEAKGNEGIFQLPRNIRQIGEGKSYLKIYMEDYVYTYLQKIAREEPVKGKGSVLLGRYNWDSGISYIFIQSALEVEEMEPAREHITLDEQVWSKIHDRMKEHFPGQEVVGWSLFLPGSAGEISDTILHTHLNHFGGNDKVLFYYQPQEKEEAFYTYENGQMVSQGGYYIYYEKNEPMQSYMIGKSRNRSIEDEMTVPDRAVNHFRKTIIDKGEEKQQVKVRSMVYAISACSVLAVLALGITFMNHYDGMKQTVEHVLVSGPESQSTSGGAQGQKEDEQPQKEENQDNVESNEKPTEETKKEEDQEKNGLNEKNEESETAAEMPTATPSPVPTGKGEQDTAAQQTGNEPTQQSSQETDKQTSAGNTTYRVKKGDTISQISAAYYGTISMVPQICQLNQISQEDIIYEGQILLLP